MWLQTGVSGIHGKCLTHCTNFFHCTNYFSDTRLTLFNSVDMIFLNKSQSQIHYKKNRQEE